MQTCDNCGGLIVPSKKGDDTTLKCRSCGAVIQPTGEEFSLKEEHEHDEDHVTVNQPDESLPTTDEECDDCGNDEAYWWMLQTRASDEPATRFFRCTECSHTWREYD